MIISIKFTIKFNNLTFGLPMYCFILFTINLELASIVGGCSMGHHNSDHDSSFGSLTITAKDLQFLCRDGRT